MKCSLQIEGTFSFTADPECNMELYMAARVAFVGIEVEGQLELSTTGGVVYALMRGSGETPTLCSACPKLKGSMEAV